MMEVLAAFNQSESGFDPLVATRCVNVPNQWFLRRADGRDKARTWNEVDAGRLRADIAEKAPAWWAYATGPDPLLIMDIEEPGLTLDDAGAPMVELCADLFRASCPRGRRPRVALYDSTCAGGALDVQCPKCYVFERKLQVAGLPAHGGEQKWTDWQAEVSRAIMDAMEFGTPVRPMLNLYMYHDGCGGIPAPSDSLAYAARRIKSMGVACVVLWGAPGWAGSGGADAGRARDKAARIWQSLCAV